MKNSGENGSNHVFGWHPAMSPQGKMENMLVRVPSGAVITDAYANSISNVDDLIGLLRLDEIIGNVAFVRGAESLSCFNGKDV